MCQVHRCHCFVLWGVLPERKAVCRKYFEAERLCSATQNKGSVKSRGLGPLQNLKSDLTVFDIIFTFQMHLASQQQDPGFQSFGQLGSLCGEFARSLWVFPLPHTVQSHAWGWDNWGFQIGCSLVCLSVLACLACTLPFTLRQLGSTPLEENVCVGLQFDLNYAAKLFAVLKEMAMIYVQTCIKTTVNVKVSYINVFPLENTSALPLTNRQTACHAGQVACCSAFEIPPFCRAIYGYSRC